MAPRLCSAESAIATCDSYKQPIKQLRKKKYKKPIKPRRFSYAELEAATNSFSPTNLLGKGSHGAVFRATLDGGALTAAVKRTTTNVAITAENEIEILSKIRSRRIVNLIGYAIDSGDRKLLLVVEYMPNGSLYDLIHKRPKPPGWSSRVRFALQVGKAVQALHGSNPPIIHRDIKSNNVLIDECANARLSDFGLALMGHVEDVREMSTPPAGTLGYLDPCYLAPGDLSTKSDVFSFGILLLEIISGRRAIDVKYSPPSIVEWALPLIKSRSYQDVCDRRIRGPADPTIGRDLAVLAAKCVRSTAEKRPSMVEIVEWLGVIYKRVQAGAILNNLRCGMRHVEISRPLDGGSDGEERVRSTPRNGSRRSSRNSKKLSYVLSSEQMIDRIAVEVPSGRHRVVRSKSTGSTTREMMEAGVIEINGVNNNKNNNRKRAQVTVKMAPIVKLSKSRSMGLLRGSSNSSGRNSGDLQMLRNPQLLKELDVDVLSLLVNSSSKAQMKATIRELSIGNGNGNGIGTSSSSPLSSNQMFC